MTYDHFRPRIQDGGDNAANLVYACYACNTFKADYWSDADDTRLLHPLNDDLSLHIAEQGDGTIKALTPLGEIYRSRLQLNRPALVAHRLEGQRVREVKRHLIQIDLTLNDVLAEIKKLR